MRSGWRILGGLGLAFLGACGAKLPDKLDADGLKDLGDVEVCDGQTLEELKEAKTISVGCKAELESLLPHPQSNFKGRVLVLGEEEQADGSLRLLVAGSDADGVAFSAEAYGEATVSVHDDVGDYVDAEASLGVELFADLDADLLSVEIVNDYSGSMGLADLDVVEQIETDLFELMPPIVEGEVTLFSDEVRVKQAFTSDREELLASVAYDATFPRELTALYDGMGTGLDSLTSRARPARVLVVSTDGMENSSKTFKKAGLVSTIADEHVFVVMLGGLFADVHELRSLAGSRGVYFYTPLYSHLREQVSELVTALTSGAEVVIPPDVASQRPLRLDIGGQSVELE